MKNKIYKIEKEQDIIIEKCIREFLKEKDVTHMDAVKTFYQLCTIFISYLELEVNLNEVNEHFKEKGIYIGGPIGFVLDLNIMLGEMLSIENLQAYEKEEGL